MSPVMAFILYCILQYIWPSSLRSLCANDAKCEALQYRHPWANKMYPDWGGVLVSGANNTYLCNLLECPDYGGVLNSGVSVKRGSTVLSFLHMCCL